MKNKKTLSTLLLTGCAFLALSSCKTVPNEYGYGDQVKPLTEKERIQKAIRSAAIDNMQQDLRSGSLVDMEAAYQKSPNDITVATPYATTLRKAGLNEQADLILRPFAIETEKASIDALVEYAKIKLEAGEFETAQLYAQNAMGKDMEAIAPYNVLGISVDAQGHHQAASNHFRNALSKIDATHPLYGTLMNNLAMSLIAQGKMKEAREALESVVVGSQLDRAVVNANINLTR